MTVGGGRPQMPQGPGRLQPGAVREGHACRDTSAARLKLTIWRAASAVGSGGRRRRRSGLRARGDAGRDACPLRLILVVTGLLAWHVAPGRGARRPAPAHRRGAARGGGRGAAGRARGLRPARPDRLLQQPLSGDDDRGAARGPGARQALRGLDARGDRARARSITRTWARTSSRSASPCGMEPPQRGCLPHRRRPLDARPREPHAGRQPGAADHRHHRGAPARRRAAPARARGRAGRRPGGDHRRRPRLHLRQPRLRDDHRLQRGRGARQRAAGHPLERDAAAGVLRRDARASSRPGGAGRERSSTATRTAT